MEISGEIDTTNTITLQVRKLGAVATFQSQKKSKNPCFLLKMTVFLTLGSCNTPKFSNGEQLHFHLSCEVLRHTDMTAEVSPSLPCLLQRTQNNFENFTEFYPLLPRGSRVSDPLEKATFFNFFCAFEERETLALQLCVVTT